LRCIATHRVIPNRFRYKGFDLPVLQDLGAGQSGVGQITTGGEQIDTMVITDHLYLHGPGGALFDINVGKDASGKAVVTATPAGG
jgi:hypothetical protein